MATARRRSSTIIALPPSDVDIILRSAVSCIISAELIRISAITFRDVFSSRHPSPSWLVGWITNSVLAMFETSQPAQDASTLWILRVLVVLVVLLACSAQVSLATTRRAVPLTVRLHRTRFFSSLGLHWRPDYFWPLVAVEAGLFLLLTLYPAELRHWKAPVFVSTCLTLCALGLTMGNRDVRDARGTGEDWPCNIPRLFGHYAVRFLVDGVWESARRKATRRSRWN